MTKLNQDANGGELLNQDENGVIWVKSELNELFGIVDQIIIIDEDGLKFENNTLSILEDAGFELDQDWENETTFIEFIHINGEVSKVVFSDDKVKLV